jgi:hypothetical protein
MRRGLLIGLLGIACGGSSERVAAERDGALDSVGGVGGGKLDGGGGASATAGRGGFGGQLGGGNGGVPDRRDAALIGDSDTSTDAVGEDARPCNTPDAAAAIPGRYCSALAALPCGQGMNVTECTSYIEESLVAIEMQGCACQLLTQLVCGVERGLICPVDFDDVRFDPACTGAEDDAQRCMNDGDNCQNSIVVGGGCDVACDQYAAECSRSGQGWDCTCSYGPKLGTRFSIASCDDETVASHCR